MADLELRPMGVGDILDVDFRLYARNFLTFVGIMAVVYVPIMILQAAFVGSVQVEFTASAMEGPRQDPERMLAIALIFVALMVVIGSLLAPIGTGALTYAVGARFLGRKAGVWSSYRAISGRIIALLLAAFLTTVICTVGFLFCVVPGVIFSLKLALAPAVVVLEGAGPIEAIGRSWSLTKGSLGKVFVVMFLMWLISLAAGTLVRQLAGLSVLFNIPASQAVGMVVSQAGNMVVSPLQAAAIVLLYYDFRIRREAFDIELLADHLRGSEA